MYLKKTFAQMNRLTRITACSTNFAALETHDKLSPHPKWPIFNTEPHCLKPHLLNSGFINTRQHHGEKCSNDFYRL